MGTCPHNHELHKSWGERWGLEPNSDKVGGSYLVQVCRLSRVLRVDQGRSFVMPGGQLFPVVGVLKTCSQVWFTALTPSLGRLREDAEFRNR